ncbi:flippase [Chryseobacterium sp. c4a]|uniref:flippase n=1 Tax=Chryseobacterium sp. c4a TaxID=1573582 RepID=UPI0013570D2F|nr:flippase [Chryseobacterium sp. c4a]
MMKEINKIFKNLKNNKNLVGNFSYLFIINIANYIIPFITFPYIVRIIGVEKFGLLSFALSIITYFTITVDYGFNLYATREVSIHRNSITKLNEIFSNVIFIKIMLSILCFFVLCIIISFFPILANDPQVYLYTFGIVIGQALLPVWYFQGIEKMKIVSVLFFISKFLSSVPIFFLVKSKEDYLIIPLLNSILSIIMGIIGIVIVYKQGVRFISISKSSVYDYLKNGWHLFLSNLSVSLYTISITTILGFFSNNTIVGYYSISDRLISAIKSVISPFSQVFYPYLSNILLTSKEKVIAINRKLLIFGGIFFLVLCSGLFLFANEIIWVIFHNNSKEVINVFRIMSFIPFIIYVHTVYALFTILVFGFNKEYSKIIISGGVINLLIAFILIPLYFHIGAALCVVIIEIYIGVRYILFLNSKNIKLI